MGLPVRGFGGMAIRGNGPVNGMGRGFFVHFRVMASYHSQFTILRQDE